VGEAAGGVAGGVAGVAAGGVAGGVAGVAAGEPGEDEPAGVPLHAARMTSVAIGSAMPKKNRRRARERLNLTMPPTERTGWSWPGL